MQTEHPKIDTSQKAFAFAERQYIERHTRKGLPSETLRDEFRKIANSDIMTLQLYNGAFKRTDYSSSDLSQAEIAAFILFTEIPHTPHIIQSASDDISAALTKYSDWRRSFEDALLHALHDGTSEQAISTIAARTIKQRQAPENTSGYLGKIKALWNRLHHTPSPTDLHDSNQSRKDAFLFKMIGAKSLKSFCDGKEYIISEYETLLGQQNEEPEPRKTLNKRYDLFLSSLEYHLRRYNYGYSAASNAVNYALNDAIKPRQ